ncbi:transcription elongation factor GreA [soil metagenome]
MTEATKHTSSFLTQEAHDRLQNELQRLSGQGRSDIAKRIEAAREEGDLKENGGYHAAKEEQGKMEARIRQLQHLLDNASVGQTPTGEGPIQPGTVVTVEMFGDTEKFLIGSREITHGGDNLDVYSELSPLGAAILDHEAGDTVTYDAPNGSSIEVKIVSAEAYRP